MPERRCGTGSADPNCCPASPPTCRPGFVESRRPRRPRPRGAGSISTSVTSQRFAHREGEVVDLRTADQPTCRHRARRSGAHHRRSVRHVVSLPGEYDIFSPGSGRTEPGSDSQVRRPITTVCPIVSSLKRARSSGSRQGIAAVAADDTRGRLRPDQANRHNGDRRFDRRVWIVIADLDIVVGVVEDRTR